MKYSLPFLILTQLLNFKLRHAISELSTIQIFEFEYDMIGIFKKALTDIVLIEKSAENTY